MDVWCGVVWENCFKLMSNEEQQNYVYLSVVAFIP